MYNRIPFDRADCGVEKGPTVLLIRTAVAVEAKGYVKFNSVGMLSKVEW